MLTRPWPIKILFLCHLLAPLINILFSAWMSSIPTADFIELKWQRAGALELFAMFGLLPLGGLVIYLCKKWSYYAYFLVMLAVFYFNFLKWQQYPHLFDISYVIGFFITNFIVVGYFMFPAVREVYFNERLRWWESEPRYVVGLAGQIIEPAVGATCKILNISLGGAQIESFHEFFVSDIIRLEFSHNDQVFRVEAQVRHGQNNIYGLQFVHSNESKLALKKMIRQEISKHFEPRNAAPPMFESFLDWVNTFTKTGKGLLPEAGVNEASKKKKLKKVVTKTKKTKVKTTKKNP